MSPEQQMEYRRQLMAQLDVVNAQLRAQQAHRQAPHAAADADGDEQQRCAKKPRCT